MKQAEQNSADSPDVANERTHPGVPSEMAGLIASFDWSRSPLGPMAQWSQNLKTALNICLGSRFQLAIYWGPEHVFLYNDAEREVIGALHPRALGRPGREILVDMWKTIEPMLDKVLKTGEATWSVDQPLMIDRYGFAEEAFFTWSYSPILDDGGDIGGVLLVTEETTQRVLANRRMLTLTEMMTEVAGVGSTRQACATVIDILGQNRADVSFALLYLLDAAGVARLSASTGCGNGIAPGQFPLEEVMQQRDAVQVSDLACFFDGGIADKRSRSALVLPIRWSDQGELAGFLVAGISGHRRMDAACRNFLELVASRIATIVASARAREKERDAAQVERELRAEADSQRALLETVLNQMPAGVVIAKAPSGEVVLANNEAEHILHRSVSQLRNVEEYSQYPLFRPDGQEYGLHEQPLARSILHGEVVMGEELRYLRPDGTFRVLFTNSAPVRDETGAIVASAVTFQDITDLRSAQEQLLQERNLIIHDLAGKLITAQEGERKRIARELHDDIAQKLALLSMELEQANRNVNGSDEATKQRLDEIRQHCIQIGREVQSLSHQLHYSKLDYLGLVGALKGFCREFAKQYDVFIDFADEKVPAELSGNVSLCLFRIAQEALRNAVKHSGVKQLVVKLSANENEVQLTVSDAGAGFNIEGAKNNPGLGLVSMQERVNLVQGRLRIESKLGEGTTIIASAPLTADETVGDASDDAENLSGAA